VDEWIDGWINTYQNFRVPGALKEIRQIKVGTEGAL
jgi:hypothetical protein